MNKKLAEWINEFPIVEISLGIFVLFFLTIVVVNLIMGGTLIDEKFIKDVLDNVIKGF